MKVPVITAYSVRHGRTGESSGPAYCHVRPLPCFYMSDHSVLGLLVDNIEQTGKVLVEHGYIVCKEPYGIDVTVAQSTQIREIVRILAVASVRCEISDVIDQVYQG